MNPQTLYFSIYENSMEKKDVWEVEAWVYGPWAVHRRHPDDSQKGMKWRVSHAKTGVAVLFTPSKMEAIKAAKALALLEEPPIVIVGEVGSKKVTRPPLSWIEKMIRALKGIRVFIQLGELVSPESASQRLAQVFGNREPDP